MSETTTTKPRIGSCSLGRSAETRVRHHVSNQVQLLRTQAAHNTETCDWTLLHSYTLGLRLTSDGVHARALTTCAEFVDYKFCARQLNATYGSNSTRASWTTEVAYMSELDGEDCCY